MTFAALGNSHTAQRIVNAENDFIASLMEIGGITKPQAWHVLAVYRKARAVKMDAVGGRISVKHGAYLDQRAIHNALNIAL